ncbi:hypothetical protein BE11_00125 [Sorangium cellulosum]|nr:hypothetical protein BE11_00125 [Sorangium cellulosum]
MLQPLASRMLRLSTAPRRERRPSIVDAVTGDEEVTGERAAVGRLLDGINARLANVQPNAVLLSRMRKLVKGMK